MDFEEHIGKLDKEGKVSPSEAEQLRAALRESVAEDEAIKLQLRERNSSKRRRRLLTFTSALAILATLGVLALFVLLSTNNETSKELTPELSGDVSQIIQALETKLRKPGTHRDYRLLAEAYQKRFEESGNNSDLSAALAADSRAKRLWKKQHKEGVMVKSGVLFGGLFIILIAAGVGLVIALPYNGLAKKDEMVDARWAQVETVLQRRLDLIPNLVETVKGYASHEKETFLAVTEARAKMLSALSAAGKSGPSSAEEVKSLGVAEKGLSSALSRLFAVVEQYPQVKASSNFLALQDQLEGTENRISVERHRYNDSVKDYNSGLRTFPSNVVGSLFDFEPRAYFESRLGAEDAVTVEFGN